MKRWRGVLAVITALGVACGTFDGTNQTSDADGGTPSANDGGVVNEASPPPDASNSTLNDAASDSSVCSLGYCSCLGDAHTICDDFDESLVGVDWSPMSGFAGSVAYTDAASISPPNAVLSQGVEAGIGGNASYGFLQYAATESGKAFKLEADLNINSGDPTGSTTGTNGVCLLRFSFDSNQFEYRVNGYGDHLEVEELIAGTSKGVQASFSVQLKTGTKGRLGIWIDAASATCGLTWNSIELLSACKVDPSFTNVEHTASLEVGVVFVRPPTATWSVLFDNVTADIAP